MNLRNTSVIPGTFVLGFALFLAGEALEGAESGTNASFRRGDEIQRPSWDSYRRLPSAARVIPATGSRASMAPAFVPQGAIRQAIAHRAAVGRGRPDVPVAVFPAGIYLGPGGPTVLPARRSARRGEHRRDQVVEPRSVSRALRRRSIPSASRDLAFQPGWLRRIRIPGKRGLVKMGPK